MKWLAWIVVLGMAYSFGYQSGIVVGQNSILARVVIQKT